MEIKTFSPKSHKIKALIYGPSWSWKTSFGWSAENVLFASAENWLLSIADKQVAFTEIKSLDDLFELRDFLSKWEHDFKTLCIDSITEISDMIKRGIEKKTWKTMQIQDWGELWNKIEGVIRDIKEIDINVIVIAQEMVEKDSDKIQRIVPSLYWKSSTKIAYYMDIVGYMYVDKEWKRTIITNTSEKLVTKDRTWKIWNDETLNFEHWVDLVSKIALWEEKILYKTMSADDIRAEKQRTVFEADLKALELCWDMDCLKSVFLDINKHKANISSEQLKNLTVAKDEMKKKIEEWKVEDEVEDKKEVVEKADKKAK